MIPHLATIFRFAEGLKRVVLLRRFVLPTDVPCCQEMCSSCLGRAHSGSVLVVSCAVLLVAGVGCIGKRFASADRKGEIRLWDPTKGQQQGQPLTAHKQWVTSLAWEPLHRNSAGERLASSSKDALIKVHSCDRMYFMRARGSSSFPVSSLVWRLFSKPERSRKIPRFPEAQKLGRCVSS